MTLTQTPDTDALIRVGAAAAAAGWVRATSGNLSVVATRDPLQVRVTATGTDISRLDPSQTVLVDAAGVRLHDVDPAPSAEAAVHARIADAIGAGAVVHTHPSAVVRIARRHPDGVEFRDLEMLKALGRPAHDIATVVPVVSNTQDSDELAARVTDAADPEVPAVIVAGHGLYAWGDDIDAAWRVTEALVWLSEVESPGH